MASSAAALALGFEGLLALGFEGLLAHGFEGLLAHGFEGLLAVLEQLQCLKPQHPCTHLHVSVVASSPAFGWSSVPDFVLGVLPAAASEVLD